jgi:hypothetical protein
VAIKSEALASSSVDDLDALASGSIAGVETPGSVGVLELGESRW